MKAEISQEHFLMGSDRDYGSEYEKRNRGYNRGFNPNSRRLLGDGLYQNRRKPHVPIPQDGSYYQSGTATKQAKALKRRISVGERSTPENLEAQQQQQSYQDEPQQVAFVQAIPVVVIGGVVLVAVGSTLFLQVQDENGETVTINQYAARPVADLLERVTNDVANYYQTEGKEKLAEIRSGASRALNKIIVRKEPEPQVYENPTDPQVETPPHTGHGEKPKVETGTRGTDLDSAPKTPPHTGGQTRSQPRPEDYIFTIETGLSDRAKEAIASLENIKKDPLGEINSRTNHNHYAAARREARGEVVARKQSGEPFSHISDLQQAYNGLQNVRKALEEEDKRLDKLPNDSPDFRPAVERGIKIVSTRLRETQTLIGRLKGFLSQIGHAPPYPPFHVWPPGS